MDQPQNTDIKNEEKKAEKKKHTPSQNKTKHNDDLKLLTSPTEIKDKIDTSAKADTKISEPEITAPKIPVQEIITDTPIKKDTSLEATPSHPVFIDIVNDTTTKAPIKHQKKMKIKGQLIILFYLIGITLGGGIVYRFESAKDTAQQKAQVLSMQTQQDSEIAANKNANTESKKVIVKSNPPITSAKAFGIFYKSKKDSNYLQLAETNADTKLPPASISKLMTALLIVEKYPLDTLVTFPAKCQGISGGSNAGFMTGDVLTIQDLLYGMLVASGADASCALSTIDENTNFIAEMNKKAKSLNMKNTKFQNAIGFDAENNQISTVNDLIILVDEVLKYNTIKKIVGTEVVEITPKNRLTSYRISSTNDLLKTIPGTIGIKTGSTPDAGECLAYLYEEKDTEILIIILGSEKRFEDTQLLLNWTKNQINK